MQLGLLTFFLLVCLGLHAGSNEYRAEDYSSLIGMEGFSDQMLQQHFKLYQGYVKNTNILIDKLFQLSQNENDRSPEYAGFKRIFGWEFDGMRLHEFYFGNLGGDGKPNEYSTLFKKIVKDFSSFELWKKDFIATGLMRGIGWVILYQDPKTGRLINAWISEHNIGNLSGSQPILVMDVWEHAYMPDYGLDRAKYIQAFFNNIDWRVVEKRAAQ